MTFFFFFCIVGVGVGVDLIANAFIISKNKLDPIHVFLPYFSLCSRRIFPRDLVLSRRSEREYLIKHFPNTKVGDPQGHSSEYIYKGFTQTGFWTPRNPRSPRPAPWNPSGTHQPGVAIATRHQGPQWGARGTARVSLPCTPSLTKSQTLRNLAQTIYRIILMLAS